MMVVPVDAPQASPVEPIVATDGVPLLHTPPGIGLVNVVQKPTHKAALPLMGPIGLTVIAFVTWQVPIA
jgi:hypothetical protein